MLCCEQKRSYLHRARSSRQCEELGGRGSAGRAPGRVAPKLQLRPGNCEQGARPGPLWSFQVWVCLLSGRRALVGGALGQLLPLPRDAAGPEHGLLARVTHGQNGALHESSTTAQGESSELQAVILEGVVPHHGVVIHDGVVLHARKGRVNQHVLVDAKEVLADAGSLEAQQGCEPLGASRLNRVFEDLADPQTVEPARRHHREVAVGRGHAATVTKVRNNH
mmetsp:Transcript_4834/g.9092  ORF Transcript_4834/g.9092 Transcript_4834/m.9092 type:complete len:222 (-) Transcript_4834:864-1529(-)